MSPHSRKKSKKNILLARRSLLLRPMQSSLLLRDDQTICRRNAIFKLLHIFIYYWEIITSDVINNTQLPIRSAFLGRFIILFLLSLSLFILLALLLHTYNSLLLFFYSALFCFIIIIIIVFVLFCDVFLLLSFPCADAAANCDNIKCKDRQKCLVDLVTHRPRCLSCNFKCPHTKRPQVNKIYQIILLLLGTFFGFWQFSFRFEEDAKFSEWIVVLRIKWNFWLHQIQAFFCYWNKRRNQHWGEPVISGRERSLLSKSNIIAHITIRMLLLELKIAYAYRALIKWSALFMLIASCTLYNYPCLLLLWCLL